MSRRKQARPIKHLDDEEPLDANRLETDKKDASQVADDESYEDFFCCVFCSTKFSSEVERDKHELTCPRASSAGIDDAVPKSCRQDDGDEINSRGVRRKRDGSSSDEDPDIIAATSHDQNLAQGCAKKTARDFALITACAGAEGDMAAASLSARLLPYTSPMANANVTFDALEKTKMAIAQFAASAMANNGQQNPAALQELAVLQSTLYAVQQQQLLQLQLIQQLSQQLQIGQSDAGSTVGDGLLKETDSQSSASSTPGAEQSNFQPSELSPVHPPHPKVSSPEETKITGDVTHTSQVASEPLSSPSVTNISPSNSSCPSATNAFSSAILSQFPGGTLADAILQTTEPPPAPDAPSTLEMLQRTAQQVLSNASQGLLATNLADELGFRANGGSASEGRKDQTFKHRCRYCGKVFSSDSALQIHIRSHTGERPFKCNICGNRFTTKGNLKVHFQRHTARFPHIKMNPHPVPEHLDKFHPPLLSQLELEDSKTPPSGGPPTPVMPVFRPLHPNALGSSMKSHSESNISSSLVPPMFSPASNPESHSPKKAYPATKELSLIPVTQEFPENLKKPIILDEQTPESASKNCENADEESPSMKVPSRNSNSETADTEGDSRMFSQDEFSDDSHSHSQEYTKANKNTAASAEINNSGPFQNPEDLSARQSPPSNLPFPPLGFPPHLPPGHFRFPFAFSLPGTLPGTLPGALPVFPPRENASVPTLGIQTPNGPVILPRDVDPAKDPAIYTNLLPRPGSNDNAWESLIEVTKTSETSKLQQLVDNIDNKVVDPNECVVCHRVLSCKSALQMHYRTHTGERPFKCKICSRAFTTKGNLKTHMGVHRAKPPARMMHICPVCHKKFINGLVLQQHIRLHTGEPTDLTPEQIQAAELRDFPAPFPFVGGFHPFMPHHPAMHPLHLPAHQPYPVNLSAAAGLAKQREPEADAGSEGRSSSIPSPTSSTSSHVPASLGHYNVDVERTSSLSQNHEDLNNAEYHEPVAKKDIKLEHGSDSEEENFGCKTSEARPSMDNYYTWLSTLPNRSQGSPAPAVTAKTEQEPLNLTPPLFNPFNVVPSPPKGINSSLSSLQNSMALPQPTFNPLNLPLSVQGRGNTTCNICLKTFACHSALEIHYRSHTKERPFKCNVCDRGFTTKGNMKQHMMTHKNRDGDAAVMPELKIHRSSKKSSGKGSVKSPRNDKESPQESKAHCLSLTIQHSGHQETQIKDEPNTKDDNRATPTPSDLHREFKYGVSSGMATLHPSSSSETSPLYIHRPSSSRSALPVPPGPLP